MAVRFLATTRPRPARTSRSQVRVSARVDASGQADAAPRDALVGAQDRQRGRLQVGRRSSPRSVTRPRSIAFAGKKAQAARVEALVREKGFIPSDLVANEGASL